MVSTRLSSSVASAGGGDSYGAGTSNGSSGGSGCTGGGNSSANTSLFSPGGKLLRSGPIAAVPSFAHDGPPTHVPPSLLNMPIEVLEKIFSYLGYKQVAHLRPVCRTLDKICQSILNSSFQRLQNQMLQRFQAIKAKMPRRESARRNHPLACESDIIETLHMRLTLLQMTFGKHIERKHCCFFAGEILDEVNRILHYVKVTNKLARPYKVTDELFDLTTMAMEFFKENIEPTLPEIAYFGTDFIDMSFSGSSPSGKYFSLDSPPHGSKGYESPASGNEVLAIEQPPQRQSNMVLRKRIRKIKQGMKRYNSQLSLIRRDMRTSKSKMADQQKQLVEYSNRLDEYDKKNEEAARKFSTLLQELNKCKTELQYWRSRTPAGPPICNNCGHVTMAPTPTPMEDLHHSAENAPSGLILGLNVDNNLPLEGIEFPVEASSSNEEDLWKLYDPKKEEKNQAKQSSSSGVEKSGQSAKASPKHSSASTSTTSKTLKRRATDEDQVDCATKKPKRSLKVRCGGKRVKT